MTLMSKCAMGGGCSRKTVGGVEEILDASDLTDSGDNAWRKTAWCAEHEQALKSDFPYRRWRTLTKRELERAPK